MLSSVLAFKEDPGQRGSAVHQALTVLDTAGLQVEFTAENLK